MLAMKSSSLQALSLKGLQILSSLHKLTGVQLNYLLKEEALEQPPPVGSTENFYAEGD